MKNLSEKKITFTYRTDEITIDALRSLAKQNKRSMSKQIDYLISKAVDKELKMN